MTTYREARQRKCTIAYWLFAIGVICMGGVVGAKGWPGSPFNVLGETGWMFFGLLAYMASAYVAMGMANEFGDDKEKATGPKHGFAFVLTVVMLLLSGFVMTGCGSLVDDDRIIAAVEKQGYSKVELRGKHYMTHGWRGCSDSDAVHYDATATNPIGKRVDIDICAGWPFKGVTVRTK